MAALSTPTLKQFPCGEQAVIVCINLGIRDCRRIVLGDPLACEIVISSMRVLHGPMWRVLAYCLIPDRLHILILSRFGSHLEFVRLLQGRTANRLRKLGYHRVWRRDIRNRLIRKEDDLADAIAHVLASPVRARIAWDWPTYPWCGSVEWPEIDEWFLCIRRGDRQFRDSLVNGSEAFRQPP